MDILLVVLLTVIITVVLVLLVEAFLYLLLRLTGLHVRLARRQCPRCRSQPAASCSDQITTTGSQNGQIGDNTKSNGVAGVSQTDETRAMCETVSASQHHMTKSNDDGGGGGINDGGVSSTNADNLASETVVKRIVEDQQYQHQCRQSVPGMDHQQPDPNRPCSCWTTVSSDIRYENEEDGKIVGLYQARLIVPASCPSAPRMNATEPGLPLL